MKIFLIILVLLSIVVMSTIGYVYINRYSIFDQRINKLIKNLMPGYIELEDFNFDFKDKKISIKNFKILNPSGFEHAYLIEIPMIRCLYRQKDEQNILKGLRISDIELIEPVIRIERLKDLRINIRHMDEVFARTTKVKSPSLRSKITAGLLYLLSPVKKIEELLEIDPVFDIVGGSFIFSDRYVRDEGYRSSVEHIEAKTTLDLRKDFKGVDYVQSNGQGLVNGREDEVLHWVTGYNPKASKLTMSNTFNIQDINFIHFRPYYDRFSPFNFKSGRASGELIFNFSNGDIGSMNEVRLSNLDLEPKEAGSYQGFWVGPLEDLVKYLMSVSDQAVFDFKIKGPMENPRFYPGPKTKRAMAGMVVHKITDVILDKVDKTSEILPLPGGEEGKKSEIEQVIDIFKSLRKSRQSE